MKEHQYRRDETRLEHLRLDSGSPNTLRVNIYNLPFLLPSGSALATYILSALLSNTKTMCPSPLLKENERMKKRPREREKKNLWSQRRVSGRK